jgi:hypothetical protein
MGHTLVAFATQAAKDFWTSIYGDAIMPDRRRRDSFTRRSQIEDGRDCGTTIITVTDRLSMGENDPERRSALMEVLGYLHPEVDMSGSFIDNNKTA